MEEEYYKNKYLKYKRKYLELKGGQFNPNYIDEKIYEQMENREFKIINFNNEENKKILDEFSKCKVFKDFKELYNKNKDNIIYFNKDIEIEKDIIDKLTILFKYKKENIEKKEIKDIELKQIEKDIINQKTNDFKETKGYCEKDNIIFDRYMNSLRLNELYNFNEDLLISLYKGKRNLTDNCGKMLYFTICRETKDYIRNNLTEQNYIYEKFLSNFNLNNIKDIKDDDKIYPKINLLDFINNIIFKITTNNNILSLINNDEIQLEQELIQNKKELLQSKIYILLIKSLCKKFEEEDKNYKILIDGIIKLLNIQNIENEKIKQNIYNFIINQINGNFSFLQTKTQKQEFCEEFNFSVIFEILNNIINYMFYLIFIYNFMKKIFNNTLIIENIKQKKEIELIINDVNLKENIYKIIDDFDFDIYLDNFKKKFNLKYINISKDIDFKALMKKLIYDYLINNNFINNNKLIKLDIIKSIFYSYLIYIITYLNNVFDDNMNIEEYNIFKYVINMKINIPKDEYFKLIKDGKIQILKNVCGKNISKLFDAYIMYVNPTEKYVVISPGALKYLNNYLIISLEHY